MKGVSRVVDPYGPYRWNGPLSICSFGKLHLIKGTWNILEVVFLPGFHGLSIRTVRTDGMGRFQSVNDRKIASH